VATRLSPRVDGCCGISFVWASRIRLLDGDPGRPPRPGPPRRWEPSRTALARPFGIGFELADCSVSCWSAGSVPGWLDTWGLIDRSGYSPRLYGATELPRECRSIAGNVGSGSL
jgi:hypothetical protein